MHSASSMIHSASLCDHNFGSPLIRGDACSQYLYVIVYKMYINALYAGSTLRLNAVCSFIFCSPCQAIDLLIAYSLHTEFQKTNLVPIFFLDFSPLRDRVYKIKMNLKDHFIKNASQIFNGFLNQFLIRFQHTIIHSEVGTDTCCNCQMTLHFQKSIP